MTCTILRAMSGMSLDEHGWVLYVGGRLTDGRGLIVSADHLSSIGACNT